jgi:hypothetical protein
MKASSLIGFKLFNALPSNIRTLNGGIKVFKPTLKVYHLSHFYSAEKFTSIENSYVL